MKTIILSCLALFLLSLFLFLSFHKKQKVFIDTVIVQAESRGGILEYLNF